MSFEYVKIVKFTLNDSHENFFSWRGNMYDFKSSGWYYWTIFGLIVFSVLTMWLTKHLIYRHYQSKTFGIFGSESNFFRIAGIIGIVFTLIRIGVLFGDGYPLKFEIIPLHLCRLILTIVFILLIFNKLEWVGYLSFLSFGSALAGFLGADLNNSPAINDHFNYKIGVDSFIFHDYILTHATTLILPFTIQIIKGVKLNWKVVLYTSLALIGLTLVVFGLNYLLGTYASNESGWRSNWFYLGLDEVNSLMRGTTIVMFKWPYNLITYILIGIVYVLFSIMIYVVQDFIYFDYVEDHFIFQFVKSQAWISFIDRRTDGIH